MTEVYTLCWLMLTRKLWALANSTKLTFCTQQEDCNSYMFYIHVSVHKSPRGLHNVYHHLATTSITICHFCLQSPSSQQRIPFATLSSWKELWAKSSFLPFLKTGVTIAFYWSLGPPDLQDPTKIIKSGLAMTSASFLSIHGCGPTVFKYNLLKCLLT